VAELARSAVEESDARAADDNWITREAMEDFTYKRPQDQTGYHHSPVLRIRGEPIRSNTRRTSTLLRSASHISGLAEGRIIASVISLRAPT
jgi:hypothetical protein